MDPRALRLENVEAAAERIRGSVVETPLVPHPSLDGVYLKLETLQRTGAFKLRGATNAVAMLSDAELRRGLATVSAGNAGLALAAAGARRGASVRVYVPSNVVERKADAMRAAGAEVVPTPLERLGEILARRDAGDGRTFLPPYGDARIAAGQGTIGIEIARALPSVRTVLVPVGGGGLSLGVSTALREAAPQARVYGVVAELAPAVANAWRTGRAEAEHPTSIADGLNAPLADLAVVEALKARLAGLLTVTDLAIRRAMWELALGARVVAEPAGAAGFAALASNPQLPRPLAVVVSGGNVDPRLLAEVLAAPEAAAGRIQIPT